MTTTATTPHARATSRAARALRIVLGLVAWLFVGTLALLVFGAFQPGASTIGVLGSFLVPIASPWFVLAGLMAIGLALLSRRVGLARSGAVLAGLALLATIGAGVITVRMMRAAPGADVSLLAALAVGAPKEGPDETRVFATIAGRPLRVDVYRPPRDTGRLPAVVYVHGGGWIKNTRGDFKPNHRWLAEQGYVVLSVDYRLADHGRPTWEAAPADVGCALTWLRRNARSLNVDLGSGFALIGDSSGGQLAINVAYAAATGEAKSSCGGGRVPAASAVITMYPAVDPAAIYRESKAGRVAAASHDFTEKFIGGTPDAVPERYRAAASEEYISPEAPPTLVVAPDNDHILPASAPREFATLARHAGVELTLVRMPYADHGFDLPFNSIGNQVRRSLTDRFLREHLQ